MTILKPSQEFMAAVREQNLGSPWQTSNADLADFTHAFYSFSKALYNEVAPRRRQNNIGRNFAYEFGYLTVEDFPNAYSFGGLTD